MASQAADQYHLNKNHFLATIKCESGFIFNAKGDDGASIGVAQIDLAYHPEIMYLQAMDPAWAIDWMARQWQNDHASEWTCWRKLYL